MTKEEIIKKHTYSTILPTSEWLHKAMDEYANQQVEYCKNRCEAAEIVLETFPESALQDQAEEKYDEWLAVKSQQPINIKN